MTSDDACRSDDLMVGPAGSRMLASFNAAWTHLTIPDIVRINLQDGSIERLPGFTTDDAAALAFWEAVERIATSSRRS